MSCVISIADPLAIRNDNCVAATFLVDMRTRAGGNLRGGSAIAALCSPKSLIEHLSGQRPKQVTQHGYPKTATPWIDPAQDLLARPKEKSGFENHLENYAQPF
jgi:hypothetical protein